MNLVDVVVKEVLVEPHQRPDGLWTTTILTNCWGFEKEREIVEDRRWKVEKYELGYRWME